MFVVNKDVHLQNDIEWGCLERATGCGCLINFFTELDKTKKHTAPLNNASKAA